MLENTKVENTRLAWIEPKVEELHIGETAQFAGVGGDGGRSGASQAS